MNGEIFDAILDRINSGEIKPVEPKEQTPHWHLKRAYALLFDAGLSSPAACEAASLIDDASRLINGKDEPTPLRRGDVVQCIGDASLAVIERVDPDGYIVVWYHSGGRLATRPDYWVRIGKAAFMPDGTKVEG